jgi:hypothetical protein
MVLVNEDVAIYSKKEQCPFKDAAVQLLRNWLHQ